MKAILPYSIRCTTALPTFWMRTSLLQHCETINICCFKWPSLWCFGATTLGSQSTWCRCFYVLSIDRARKCKSMCAFCIGCVHTQTHISIGSYLHTKLSMSSYMSSCFQLLSIITCHSIFLPLFIYNIPLQ